MIRGADPTELRRIAGRVEHRADEYDDADRQISYWLNRLTWQGPDAQRFRSQYQRSMGPELRHASHAMREAARQLRSNAAEQHRASNRGPVWRTPPVIIPPRPPWHPPGSNWPFGVGPLPLPPFGLPPFLGFPPGIGPGLFGPFLGPMTAELSWQDALGLYDLVTGSGDVLKLGDFLIRLGGSPLGDITRLSGLVNPGGFGTAFGILSELDTTFRKLPGNVEDLVTDVMAMTWSDASTIEEALWSLSDIPVDVGSMLGAYPPLLPVAAVVAATGYALKTGLFIGDTTYAVGEKVYDAISWTGNELGGLLYDGYQFAGGVVDAGARVANEAAELGGDIVDGLIDTGEAVVDFGGDVVNAVGDAGGWVIDKVKFW